MKDIEGAIRSFLELAEHKSLLIRGDWGTGKTYLARKVLSEKHSDSHLFVSLYGLKSREELDLAVAAQAIARAPKQKLFRDQGRHVNELLRILRIERLAAHVAKETIKANIVCFDDVERKDDDLSIQTIVSYIDGLNNSYGTKTICIVNTDRLSEKEQDWLRENAEKTFGKRMRVEPPPSHIREIAVGTVDLFDGPIASLLEAFNVTNIRIAMEISQNCRAFLSSVGEGERRLENDELRNRLTTVAAATASLSGLRDFPAPDFLRETMDQNRFDFSKDPTGDDERWRGTLSELGYRITDRFDHLLINQIDRGYFSRDEIEAHFREVATGVAAGGQTKYSAAWREYHDAIGEDTEGFVQRFFHGALESLASIEGHNMNGSVRLLNYLGEPDRAKELASQYVGAHKGRGPYFLGLQELEWVK